MTLRLGLDLGSTSLGWCLIEKGSDNSEAEGVKPRIVASGVRIFSSGRDPKTGASLAVDRRNARSARRRQDRYLARRQALLAAMVEEGLMPEDRAEAKALVLLDPYDLRTWALDKRLEPYALGRALFHLNQRRGFKSNRKAETKAKPGEKGKIKAGAQALDAAMAAQGARTLGEFLHRRDEKRVRMGGESQAYDFYPQRRHYEEEFAAIWNSQVRFNPELLTDRLHDRLHRIIFYQRPLKKQAVGVCLFAGFNGVPEDEPRIPKAHPLFQKRRLYEEVNHLAVIGSDKEEKPLNKADRDKLIRKLQDRKKVKFSTLGKVIGLAEGAYFNKEGDNRKELVGDEVRAVLGGKKCFGSRWQSFDDDEQWEIVERLLEEEDPDVLHEWLKSRYGLDDDTAEAVANAPLPVGYGRLGVMATRAILTELEEDVCTYSEAAERAGFNHSDFSTGEVFAKLPYYGEVLNREIMPGVDQTSSDPEKRWGKVTNPTVHIGLNQLRRLVNAIIRTYGRPDEIVIELARDLKMNKKQKDAFNKQLKANTEAAQARSVELRKMNMNDSGANRMLLRLWKENNPDNPADRRCPYCDEQVSFRMIAKGEVEIDHIIPYSKCLDDSASNKVVSHRRCNREKRNRTPWEAWGRVSDQVAKLPKSKQWRFGPDAMDRVEKDDGFKARQLKDTQYLSRIAQKYLKTLYPEEGRQVYAITGKMTAMLRRLWGLNTLLPDHNRVENIHSNNPKNRLDHRHHTIDAAVVAVTDNATIDAVSTAAARAEDQNLDRMFQDLAPPWESFREDLYESLKGIIVSYKADHGLDRKALRDPMQTAAQLHNDTVYGLTGEVTDKGMPIVVHRVPLLDLKEGHFMDPDAIADQRLRDALYTATEGLSGKTFRDALQNFARQPGPYQGIRRVRLRQPLNVIPIRDRDGRVYKAFKGDSNARYDVWRLPGGKWVVKWKNRDGHEESGVIQTFDIHQPGFVAPRPHPAAKKVLSLKQNDLLAIERNGEDREIVRVVLFTINGNVLLANHQEAGALQARDRDKNDPFKYINCTASSLKKIRARQVRIDPLGRVDDPGFRE